MLSSLSRARSLKSTCSALAVFTMVSLCLFSIAPLVTEAASTVTMTKSNTGYAKNYWTQHLAAQAKLEGFSKSQVIAWCKNPVSPGGADVRDVLGLKYDMALYISQSSGTMFDILAWCVANDVIVKALFENPVSPMFPSPGYSLGTSHNGEWGCMFATSGCNIRTYSSLTSTTYSQTLLSKTPQLLAVQGTQGSGTTNTDSGFTSIYNSPFIYFKNPPANPVTVKLSSLLNEYTPKPAFTSEYAWTDTFTNESELFYELQIPAITLSRAGQNFSSKAELVAYLETGDFFDRMHFTELQKQNSLGYIVPKIPTDSPNYYLTILSPESIADISQLDISSNPVIERNFFAIYPSAVSVATTDALQFPEQAPQSDAFTVTELGEVLVDSMVINWTE